MFKIVPSESDDYTHKLVGLADAKDLLDGSIEKWVTVARFKAQHPQALVEDGGTVTCPLCRLYHANDCDFCPIAHYTGYWHCEDTPYDDYCEDPSLTNARAELCFLYQVKEEQCST